MKAFELIEQLKQELADMTLGIEAGWINSLDVMGAVKSVEQLAKDFNTEELKSQTNKEAVKYGKTTYQKQILSYIRENGGITKAKAVKLLGPLCLTKPAYYVGACLDRMVGEKMIRRTGRGVFKAVE